MPFHLLPGLKKNYTVKEFDDAGLWEKRDSDELDRISKSLDVADIKLASAEVDSIPSMWARPLLFEMALYEDDTNYPIHKHILGEWRGLLAMLALKEWCDFPITIEQVDITDTQNQNPPDAKDFLQALQKLMPKARNTLDGKTTWETQNIILYNENPIGITSPTTLVCTAVNYSKRISGVPWFNGKFLINPVDKLNGFEKDVVAGWLKNLENHILLIPAGKEIKNSIIKILDSFIVDLGKPPAVTDFSSTSLGFAEDLFKSMNNPVAPRDLPSSIELVPSKNKQPEIKLLIFDSEIPNDWGKEPHDVIVWNCKTMATTQSFSRESKLALPPHVHLRKSQDFFTDQLFVIDETEAKAFQENSTLVAKGIKNLKFNGKPVTPILPIRQELLTYLNVRDINNRITFEQHNDSIEVRLCLTLSGINGANLDFVISKKYGAANVTLFSNCPILAIWPNFRNPNWKAYYTYFTTDGYDTFNASPYMAVGEFADTQIFDEKEITKTERFPDAMICEYKGIQAGILPISTPEEIIGVDKTDWNIGVDFGTSSTTVYYRRGNDNPQAIVFKNRLLNITYPPYLQPIRFYNEFLSPESEQTPFFSLYQTIGNNGKGRPILDGHIYFFENYSDVTKAKNLVSDLKWSTSEIDKEHLKVFLKQLCLQCAAEAISDGATQINWNFSHPLAFTERDRGLFERIWGEVGSACETATGLSQKVITPAESESIVIAKFFAGPKGKAAAGSFAIGSVCIDIGGETSDISIWQNNKLYWQTSLRFAGRHIFLNLLKENPIIYKYFDAVPNNISLSKRESKGGNDKFYVQADALIRDKGQEWFDKLATVSDESAIQPFIQLISLGVAGLLHYVGLLLNYLSQSGTGFNAEISSIYIGGNGSNILHWISEGNFNQDTIAKRCRNHLNQVIRNALRFDSENDLNIVISEFPKQEAAYGLVIDGVQLKTNPTRYDILAGEVFTQAGTNFGWDETLTAERLHSRLSIFEDNLEQIQNFIDSFNASLGAKFNMPVDLDEIPIRKDIFMELEGVFQDYSNTDPKEISVQPLFILALKALLNAKTSQWQNTED